MSHLRRAALLALLTIVSFAGIQAAGYSSVALAAEPSRAADAFDEGRKAFAAGAYRKAALLFEEAHSLAPHPSTLFNAANARLKAGDTAHAANHYTRIVEEAKVLRDREDAIAARKPLDATLGRIFVSGEIDGTSVEATIDGAKTTVPLQSAGLVYVDPGEHTVTGRVQGRPARKVVQVAAGALVTVALAAEPARGGGPVVPRDETPSPGPLLGPAPGLPRVVTYILGGATIVAGGVTIWSGLDVLAQRDQWERSRLDADVDEGLARQERTNVLIGVTAGLALLTGVVALFTTWRSPSPPSESTRGQGPFRTATP